MDAAPPSEPARRAGRLPYFAALAVLVALSLPHLRDIATMRSSWAYPQPDTGVGSLMDVYAARRPVELQYRIAIAELAARETASGLPVASVVIPSPPMRLVTSTPLPPPLQPKLDAKVLGHLIPGEVIERDYDPALSAAAVAALQRRPLRSFPLDVWVLDRASTRDFIVYTDPTRTRLFVLPAEEGVPAE